MKTIIWAIFAAILALSVAVIVNFNSLRTDRASARRETCQRFVQLDNTLIGIVRSGEKSLSSFSYYKTHPKEKALVIQQDENVIKQLTPPTYC